MTPNNVIPLRIPLKRQGILEQELRALIKRHALMTALVNANATLHAIARDVSSATFVIGCACQDST